MSASARALLDVVHLARPERGRLALSLLLGVAAAAAGIALLSTSGYLISKAALRPPVLALAAVIAAVRALSLGRAALRYLERLASHDVAFRILADLRVRVYERLVPLAPAGLGGRRAGDVLSRAVADVEALQDVFLRALGPPAVAPAPGALAVLAAWLLLPAAAAVLAGALVLAATGVPVVALLAGRAAAAHEAPARAELTADLVELLDGTPELVAYGRDGEWAARVAAADRRLGRLARRDALLAALTSGLETFVAGAAVSGVLLAAVPAVRSGALDGVLLAALALLTLSAFEVVSPLPLTAQRTVTAANAARRVAELTGSEPPVRDPATPWPLDGPCVVRLEGVSARYGPGAPLTLDDVDLELAPGRRVAVVGPSGAGKTTLAYVLARFLEPEAGRAAIDGRDFSEYAADDVRAAVRLAAQDAYVFTTSIRENVRLARPGAADRQIVEALGRAGAWDWVASLPDGLDTQVGEDGAQLSGGQRQRLLLARALLADARILVFDEPTTHLDPRAARAFLADLLAATSGTGLLLITHDLTGLEPFDEIVVLEAGRVTERGTHAELARRRGRFRELLAASPST